MQHAAPTESGRSRSLQTGLLTSVAMVAFAANSILCREVLRTDNLDAASFTTVRIVAGALTLWAIVRVIRPAGGSRRGTRSWTSAVMLFAYAASFSFAYLELRAATGALILFASVQATMMLSGLCTGERLSILEWTGCAIAVTGFLVLVFPGLTAPTLSGAALMVLAGVAWGWYSLLGRTSQSAVYDSAVNFLLAAPLSLVVSLLMLPTLHGTPRGLLLAAVSGSLTTGCAYVIWYQALNGLTVIHASIVQLSVPVLAGLGGVALLAEPFTTRLVLAGGLILGGIALGLGGLSRRISGP